MEQADRSKPLIEKGKVNESALNYRKSKTSNKNSEENKLLGGGQWNKLEPSEFAVDFKEIASEDVELWLFKVPKQVDLSQLNNSSLKSSKLVSNAKVAKFEDDGEQFDVIMADQVDTRQLINVFPSKAQDKLVLALLSSIHRAQTC